MDPFAVAGNDTAVVYPKNGTTQLPEGIAVHICIVTIDQFHTTNTAIVDIIVDNLNILAAFCFHTQCAAAKEAAIFHQNILAVHKEQYTTQAVPRFLCMTHGEALNHDVCTIKEIQHIGVSGNG